MDEIELIEREAVSESPVLRLTNLLSKIYDEKISMMTDDIFLNQKAVRFVLSVLSKKEGLTQNEIVRVTHMKGSTISVTLAKLEEKEMIIRNVDAYDSRCVRVFLTDKGRELNQKREELLNALDNVGKKDITPREIKEAIFVLETYLKNLLKK